eukprot:4731055-Prymnesium_polylepis.1
MVRARQVAWNGAPRRSVSVCLEGCQTRPARISTSDVVHVCHFSLETSRVVPTTASWHVVIGCWSLRSKRACVDPPSLMASAPVVPPPLGVLGVL